MGIRFGELNSTAPLGRLGDYFSGAGVTQIRAQDFPESSHCLRISDPTGQLALVLECDPTAALNGDFLFSHGQGPLIRVENARYWLEVDGALWFETNEAIERAQTGDCLFVFKLANGRSLVVVAACGSTLENQLFWLFDLPREFCGGFVAADATSFVQKAVRTPETIILANLELVAEPV